MLATLFYFAEQDRTYCSLSHIDFAMDAGDNAESVIEEMLGSQVRNIHGKVWTSR